MNYSQNSYFHQVWENQQNKNEYGIYYSYVMTVLKMVFEIPHIKSQFRKLSII